MLRPIPSSQFDVNVVVLAVVVVADDVGFSVAGMSTQTLPISFRWNVSISNPSTKQNHDWVCSFENYLVGYFFLGTPFFHPYLFCFKCLVIGWVSNISCWSFTPLLSKFSLTTCYIRVFRQGIVIDINNWRDKKLCLDTCSTTLLSMKSYNFIRSRVIKL